MKIPNVSEPFSVADLSLARIVSEDSQLSPSLEIDEDKSSKDS